MNLTSLSAFKTYDLLIPQIIILRINNFFYTFVENMKK